MVEHAILMLNCIKKPFYNDDISGLSYKFSRYTQKKMVFVH